jgi:hypothetical protein
MTYVNGNLMAGGGIHWQLIDCPPSVLEVGVRLGFNRLMKENRCD